MANNENMSCTCSSHLQSTSNQVDKGLRMKNDISFPKSCVENEIFLQLKQFSCFRKLHKGPFALADNEVFISVIMC